MTILLYRFLFDLRKAGESNTSGGSSGSTRNPSTLKFNISAMLAAQLQTIVEEMGEMSPNGDEEVLAEGLEDGHGICVECRTTQSPVAGPSHVADTAAQTALRSGFSQ